MNKYKTIIIGAGPAGLFAAIHAAQAGGKVLLLEKMSSPVKKLFI
jgi:predicted flavoprotein YhiN